MATNRANPAGPVSRPRWTLAIPPVASSSKVKGWTFEVRGPGAGIHTMHVSEDGEVRQIEYADTSVIRAITSTTIGGG